MSWEVAVYGELFFPEACSRDWRAEIQPALNRIIGAGYENEYRQGYFATWVCSEHRFEFHGMIHRDEYAVVSAQVITIFNSAIEFDGHGDVVFLGITIDIAERHSISAGVGRRMLSRENLNRLARNLVMECEGDPNSEQCVIRTNTQPRNVFVEILSHSWVHC